MFNKRDRIVHKTLNCHGSILSDGYRNSSGFTFYHVEWYDLELSNQGVPVSDTMIMLDYEYYRDKKIDDILC
jgi:hypothetical protein